MSLLKQKGADLNIIEHEHQYPPLTMALVLGHQWVAMELMKEGVLHVSE